MLVGNTEVFEGPRPLVVDGMEVAFAEHIKNLKVFMDPAVINPFHPSSVHMYVWLGQLSPP